jgi:hypothetical protein
VTTTSAKCLPAAHQTLLNMIVASPQTNAQITTYLGTDPQAWQHLSLLADQGLVAMFDSIGWVATQAGQDFARTLAGKP